ncbi:glycosyltransferase [Lichenicoccus sp.]|uniref:glycosyltransferase n=1 Tax=Lichenicoccus sp. TaxID=2781899 RepID=UPI003D1465A4
MTIPPRLHFFWIGKRLPWAYVFAVISAVERSEIPDIIFHHTDRLEDGAERSALEAEARVRMVRIDPAEYLAETGDRLGLAEAFVALYRRLESPVARSDLLRAAILYREGGIYLDLDTVTIASLLPLLDVRHFLGSELIVWPQRARTSRSPVVLSRHLVLDLVRKACRRIPHGWALFRQVERFYTRSVNNAVMGAEAGSDLVANYLVGMVRASPEQQTRRYGLGPDLLREVVRRYDHAALVIHRPAVFYPLAPEISEHWFRIASRIRLRDVLSRETRVAHWYASVRTKALVAHITPGYVRRNRDRQLYSALVCASIDEFTHAT